MDTTITLSQEAIEGLEALGRMLKQLTPLELAYHCGEIHGRADRQREAAAAEQDDQ